MAASRVLLVDDEPHVTEALKRALRDETYQILTASSAQEALAILAEKPVDVIVADERMPGMSGSEMLAAVSHTYPETIRIILTGHADLEAAMRAINESGLYRFLLKPCNDADLAMTIQHALRQKELLGKAQRLLQMVKDQASELERLERDYPGITKVTRDAAGAIVLKDSPLSYPELLKEIDQQIHRVEERSNQSLPT